MISLLLAFGGGVVVGVLYHAVLQPYVSRLIAYVKEKGKAPDEDV